MAPWPRAMSHTARPGHSVQRQCLFGPSSSHWQLVREALYYKRAGGAARGAREETSDLKKKLSIGRGRQGGSRMRWYGGGCVLRQGTAPPASAAESAAESSKGSTGRLLLAAKREETGGVGAHLAALGIRGGWRGPGGNRSINAKARWVGRGMCIGYVVQTSGRGGRAR
jgi:hypothetical protein